MTRRNLVPTIAELLRERVFAEPDGERIGSLRELAGAFEVGIVTIQQAARVLEHEGLLEVRRGLNGGYFGRRPDAASLERSLAAWMRTRPNSYAEALDITSLLFIQFCGAAATKDAPEERVQLTNLLETLSEYNSESDIGLFEATFINLLFRMVDRPIFELLTRVNLRFANAGGGITVNQSSGGIARWAEARRRIIEAILAHDEQLARFEADRGSRKIVMEAVNSFDGA